MKNGLGRGLDSLFKNYNVNENVSRETIQDDENKEFFNNFITF